MRSSLFITFVVVCRDECFFCHYKFTNRLQIYKYMDQGGKVIHKELSYLIVGILFEVYNQLGYGHKEIVYEKAAAKMLFLKRIKFKRQAPYKLTFKGEILGRYYIDFVIEDKIVLEIKRGNYFSRQNISQIEGYLKATNLQLAILAHFTPSGVKIFRAFNPNNKIIK